MNTLRFCVCLILTLGVTVGFSQTSTTASGNWSEAATWTNGVPAATTTATVLDPLVLDIANMNITSGLYDIYQNVTNTTGVGVATLTMTGGTLDIRSGTTTFRGAATVGGCTINVRNGATLVLASFDVANSTTITVEAGGTIIVNGNFTNSNSSGVITINGLVQVNGEYITNNGNLVTNGTGDLIATRIHNQGSSTVFGSSEDCASPGPCSGRNLCNYTNTITPNATTTSCANSTATLLTGSTVASPVYSWQVSTTSSVAGFSQVATTRDYTTPAYTQTTWVRRVVTSGGCTGITPAVQFIVTGANSWTGAVSTAWNVTGNWCGGALPTSTTDVVIPSSATNQPTIPSGYTASVRNLTINTGATVTLAASGTAALQVYGNLTNSGAFIAGSGSVVSLLGTAQQTLTGNAIDFSSLTVNNSFATAPQITMNLFSTVGGTLTATAGRVNLSGFNFTLGTGTGSTGTLSGTGSIFYNGDFTRWFAAGSVTLANGLFPVGTQSLTRPFSVSTTANITTGGRIRIGHTSASTVDVISLQDPDAANTIILRQNSYWRVSTISLAGGTYTINAGGTGFDNVTNVSHLRLLTYNGTTNSVVGSSGTNSGSISPSSNVTVARTGLTLAQLSRDFYIGSTNAASPMPVELLYFRGKLAESIVSLDWATAAQKTFDFFEIERSSDGKIFKSIGSVDGPENSLTKVTYNHLDQSPSVGKNYYRLKSVDTDGSFEYSHVIMIDFAKGSKRFEIFPNPSDGLFVNFESNFETSPSDQIVIYNQLGVQVGVGTLSGNSGRIEFSRPLDAGAYILKYNGNYFRSAFRLVVK